MFLANLDERSQTILYLLQFLSIFLIGILQFLERPGRVYIVAGVYSDLIGIQGSYIGNVGIEVDIGTDRLVVAVGNELSLDVLEVLSLTAALSCQTDKLASGIDYAFSLGYTGIGIVGICCRHRLNPHRIITANVERSGMSYRTFPSFIIK